MEYAHKWKPIEDLPADWRSWVDSETKAIHDARGFYAEHLDPEDLASFDTEFYREWAIETGQIEGVYNLDKGVTETLIKQGIDASLIPHSPGGKSSERIAQIIRDHLDALEGIFDFVKSEAGLTTSFIRQLHQVLLRNEDSYTVVDPSGKAFEKPLEKGKYKDQPNNPRRRDDLIHEYCPPEHVASEMERLVELHSHHLEESVPADIAACWLHHAFTQIHPFPDGNGRVARGLASAVLIKGGLFPLVVQREERGRYIDALFAADSGRPREFYRFGKGLMRTALVRLSGHIRTRLAPPPSTESLDDVVRSVKADLVNGGKLPHPIWKEQAAETERRTLSLEGLARTSFNRLAETLRQELGALDSRYSFNVEFAGTVGEGLPGPLGQAGAWSASRRFLLRMDPPGDALELYSYGLGAQPRGLGASHLSYRPAKQDAATGEPFLVYFTEAEDDCRSRFNVWIGEQLKWGVEKWQQRVLASR